MSTDLEQRLRAALQDDAARARLVNLDRPVDEDAERLGAHRLPDHSWRRVMAVAAVITVILVASLVVAGHRDRSPVVTTPPEPTFKLRDVLPGSTVELPIAPLRPRAVPALVWTGTEMIVWGGGLLEYREHLGDGAAFDPATGTWRVIASAPIEARSGAQVAWTGTEMIVVGGYNGIAFHVDLRDGAAYDPTTDSWRRLPEAPTIFGDHEEPIWTGEEFIAFGGRDGPVAYSPETNVWRQLAKPPGELDDMIWTGEALLMIARTPVQDGTVPFDTSDARSSLVRYDLLADEWQTVDAAGSYASLAAVPDASGGVRDVLAVPKAIGAPVTVLDRTGRTIGTLPGLPVDRATFGDHIEADAGWGDEAGGVWTGAEELFWIRSSDSPGAPQHEEPWALDPEAGTWRRLDATAPASGAHLELVSGAGVLIGWGPTSDEDAAPSAAIAYRAP